MSLVGPAKRVAPAWVKVLSREGFRRYGCLTAERRPLPDYLIVGAKRGGTTSLWKNLRKHPQVLPMFPAASDLKSPHFFDINWGKGETWYRSYFPSEAARERRAQNIGRPVIVGEASPYYLFHPRAAERAATLVPHAKIIVALRHPVDRAVSHYHERRKAGTEPYEIADAIAAESHRLKEAALRMAEDPLYYSSTHDFSSYLARGRYLEQLEPWLTRFASSRVLILRSETYYQQPTVVLREVFRFLGVDEDVHLAEIEHMNRLPATPLDPAIRGSLNDYFRPHVESLQTALDRDFGWDLSSVRPGGDPP